MIITRIIPGLLVSLFILHGCASTGNSSTKNNSQAADFNARLGAQYLQNNRLELAKIKLEKALEQNSRSAPAHHYYALLLQELDQPNKAQKHFKRALRLSGNSPELHNNYGQFLCKHKQYQAALKEFTLAVKNPLYSTPEYAYTNAGICSKDAGNLPQANNYFQKALSKNPKFTSALYQTSELKYQQRQFSKAQAFLYRFNELSADTPESLSLCIKISEKLGELDKKTQCLNSLLRKYPNTKQAIHHGKS